jgi:DNA-binding response OmpR family regulator
MINQLRGAPSAGGHFRDAAFQSLRILVVDDNPDSAVSLAMLLQLSGHETFIAHDGAAALDAADLHRPHVMLLDIRLPGIDGYEVCRRVRRQEWARGMAIVAVTGSDCQEDRCEACVGGFDAHVIKPMDYRSLVRLLEAVTQSGRYR